MKKLQYTTDKFINGNWIFKPIENHTKYYIYYTNSKELTYNTINYSDIINILNTSKLKTTYIEAIKNYNTDLIKQSNIHGLSHIIRTSIFLLIISTIEKIKNHDFKIMLESILYHDIGRTNDIDDEFHGYNAINKLDFLKEKYNNTEYNIICAIITGHCIDDKHHNKVAEYFNVKNKSKYYKLLSLVKDADALDRVREYPYIDIKFLRNNTTKKLVPFAYEFFYNYENN